jgi:hypothetical protein
MNKIPFDDLAPGMQTGDLVLFNGKYEGSKFIELLEGSEWSHVGMVVRRSGFDGPLIWEATSLTNLPDVLFHDQKPGPKLVDLKERLMHYGDDLKHYENANFAYRKLEVERTESMLQAIEGLFVKLHGIPDPGFWEMIWEVALGRIFHKRVALDHYFCSELVAETYLAMGLIDDTTPINAYMPVDFADKGKLKLLKGRLEPEILIDIKHI